MNDIWFNSFINVNDQYIMNMYNMFYPNNNPPTINNITKSKNCIEGYIAFKELFKGCTIKIIYLHHTIRFRLMYSGLKCIHKLIINIINENNNDINNSNISTINNQILDVTTKINALYNNIASNLEPIDMHLKNNYKGFK